MQDFKCRVSPDYGPQFFRFFFMVHRCKTMVLDISHATLAYTQFSKVFEDLKFRGRGQEQGQGKELSSKDEDTDTDL